MAGMEGFERIEVIVWLMISSQVLSEVKMPREIRTINHEFYGKTYQATYAAESGIVTVESAYGTEKAHLHEGPAQTLAHIIFGVILTKAQERGDLGPGPFDPGTPAETT